MGVRSPLLTCLDASHLPQISASDTPPPGWEAGGLFVCQPVLLRQHSLSRDVTSVCARVCACVCTRASYYNCVCDTAWGGGLDCLFTWL